MPDRSEIRADEFHPAARAAYRWIKGYMVANEKDWLRFKLALEVAAASGNRQAEICQGTIERLANSQPVSDRYLLGLCWTLLNVQNAEAFEAVASQRWDQANPPSSEELGYPLPELPEGEAKP